MEWCIAVGLCAAFLALGLLGGRWVQEKIDRTEIEGLRDKKKALQAENIALKKRIARVFVAGQNELDKMKDQYEQERRVFMIAIEDLKSALLVANVSLDVYRKGGKSGE